MGCKDSGFFGKNPAGQQVIVLLKTECD